MFRVFSGSCMSLEDMDTVLRPHLVEHPHLLGPGVDYFTESGEPVRPQPGANTFQKVFSGSALDLNAGSNELSDEEGTSRSPLHPVPHPASPSSILNQISTENERERARATKMKIQVLVIGESGYLASHVVARLLEAGYSVRMTVPDAVRMQKQVDLYGSNRDLAQRLTVLQADVTNSNSLRDAIRGCRYIIHCGCASATSAQSNDPVALYTKAIRALFDGIRLSGKSTVKRVVLTGAASSVMHINEEDPASGLFDENHWNGIATPETDPLPYAKLIFEREAWRIRQMMGVELVVLLPSISIGPSLTDETSEAMVIIEGLANSSRYFPFCPNLSWNFVDVRDVADAHVRALEAPEARDQRIIISNECVSLPEVCRMMKALYPQLTPPTHTAWTVVTLAVSTVSLWNGVNLHFLWRSLGVRKRLDNRRAKEQLGLAFTPMQQTLGDCLRQMLRTTAVASPESGESGTATASHGKPLRGVAKTSNTASSQSFLVHPAAVVSILTVLATGAAIARYMRKK